MAELDPWEGAAGTQPTATPAATGDLDPWEAAPVVAGSKPTSDNGGGLVDYIPGSLRRGYNRLEQAANVAGYETGILSEEDAIKNIVANQADIALTPPPENVVTGQQEILNSEGVMDTLWNIVTNPSATASLVGESTVASIPSIVGGGAGAVAGTMAAGPAGGLAGAATGAGLGGGATEYAMSIIDGLSKHGVDTSNPEALRQALNDPAVIDAVRKDAFLRGAIIGAVDAGTLGISSKIAAPAVRGGSVLSRAGRGTAALGVEAAGGSAGEAGAQLATEGEINVPEVVLEGALEVVPGSAEALIGAVAGSRGEKQPAADPWEAGGGDVTQVTEAPGEVLPPAPAVGGVAPVLPTDPELPVPPVSVPPGAPESAVQVPQVETGAITAPVGEVTVIPP